MARTGGETLMPSRESILGSIRASLGRGPLGKDSIAEIERSLCHPSANTIPARGEGTLAERIDTFVKMANKCDCTVERLTDVQEVRKAVKAYLRRANQPTTVRAAPTQWLKDIPWTKTKGLIVNFGKAENEDHVGLIAAWCGFAESGTAMALSGPDTPTTLNFLPDTHIILLKTEDLLGSYEEGWSRLRARSNDENFMPRTVNLITGPSRTADIEQTLLLGVHGPRRVHVLLIGSENGD